jgi:hypothetical protein
VVSRIISYGFDEIWRVLDGLPVESRRTTTKQMNDSKTDQRQQNRPTTTKKMNDNLQARKRFADEKHISCKVERCKVKEVRCKDEGVRRSRS